MTAAVTAHDVGLDALDSLQGLDSLCIFVGEDERPLQGAAGYLDWRLCGAVSRVVQSGFFVGAPGDTLLLPTHGRINIPRVFAVGIGSAKSLTEPALASALKTAAAMLKKAKAQAVALELPGVGRLQDAARAEAVKANFLSGFDGTRVALLGEKALGKLLEKPQ